jgi:nucleotide-binding universal stress UspA family protein
VYTSIVVGTDGSPTAARAVEQAAALAALTGATLRLVRAYRPPSRAMTFGPESGYAVAQGHGRWDDEVHVEVQAMLDELAAKLTNEGLTVTTHAVPRAAADALMEVADRCKAELIVVGNRGMTGVRRVLGSVPNGVAHKAECDVMIVDTA